MDSNHVLRLLFYAFSLFALSESTKPGLVEQPASAGNMLIRHPKLRVYVMHAGWPMLNEMIYLLYLYPQVYVDVTAIDCYCHARSFIDTYEVSWRPGSVSGSCSALTQARGRRPWLSESNPSNLVTFLPKARSFASMLSTISSHASSTTPLGRVCRLSIHGRSLYRKDDRLLN
jgi:hypothetical protein